MGNKQSKKGPLVPEPSWMEDSTLEFCYSCRSVFSKINRRHHCRRCRNLYCGKCSNIRDKIMVYNLLGEKNRICQGCIVLVKAENHFLANFYPMLTKGMEFEIEFSLSVSTSLGSRVVPNYEQPKKVGTMILSIQWNHESQIIQILNGLSTTRNNTVITSFNIPVINLIRVDSNIKDENESCDKYYISLLFDHTINDEKYNTLKIWNNVHSQKEVRFWFDALKALVACKRSWSHSEIIERERDVFLQKLGAENLKQKKKEAIRRVKKK